MRHAGLLIFLGFLGGSLMVCAAPLYPHTPHGEKKAKPNEIEGVWTWVSEENEGRVVSFSPAPARALGTGPAGHGMLLWKISKDEIEMVSHRCAYELHPENKPGTMDLIPLDKNGKKLLKEKHVAIYFLTDDWLFICSSPEVRPESFTTSGKPPSRFLHLLRRGELK